MKGRPRKFRTNYTRKRNRGDNKTGYIIGNTSNKKSVSHTRRGPIETEETFSKGYLRMNNSNADVRTIIHWVIDRHGEYRVVQSLPVLPRSYGELVGEPMLWLCVLAFTLGTALVLLLLSIESVEH